MLPLFFCLQNLILVHNLFDTVLCENRAVHNRQSMLESMSKALRNQEAFLVFFA